MNSQSDIPFFPDSRPMDLADKTMFDRIFFTLQPRISEFTFAGLYLFRKTHAYGLAMVGDSLVILGKGYDDTPCFLPPLSGDIPDALKLLFAQGLSLYGAEDTFRKAYLDDDLLQVAEDRDSFDYLYLRSDLAGLSGNRFHKKKNRVNYFTSRHGYRVEHFDEPHVDGCLQLLKEWGRVRGESESLSLRLESEAAAEALLLARQLGLEGVVVLVDGAIKAFALGERLNSTTSVCHFEKGDPFMEGISQLVDQEFNRLLFTDCTWVNREQDLGEPGLRAAKLSYHPVELVRKFRVSGQQSQRASMY